MALDATVDDRLIARNPMTKVKLYCGLRCGEALGLTVRAVDWERHWLNVFRTYGEAGGKPNEEMPKDRERWYVPYPKFLTLELEKVTNGKGPGEDSFSNSADSPVQGSNWLPRVYRPALNREWIPDAEVRIIHDLRHTFASLAVQAGANVKQLQRAMGHADAAMTLNVYADLFEDDYAQLGTMLEPTAGQLRAIARAEESKMT